MSPQHPSAAPWRAPLVEWTSRALRQGRAEAPPTLPSGCPMLELWDRLGLGDCARTTLALLYGSWLLGEADRGIPVATLAAVAGDDSDFTESLGGGRLGRANVLRHLRGRVRLHESAARVLDDAPARVRIFHQSASPIRPVSPGDELSVHDAGAATVDDTAQALANLLTSTVAVIDLLRDSARLRPLVVEARLRGAVPVVVGVRHGDEAPWLSKLGGGAAVIVVRGGAPAALATLRRID